MTTDVTNPAPPARKKLALADLMALVAGVAASLWMVRGEVDKFNARALWAWLNLSLILLWGVTLVGPLLLVVERRCRPFRGIGELFWLIQGCAAWLLAPPYAIASSRGGLQFTQIDCVLVYFDTLPILSIFVVLSLLVCGRFPRRRLRRGGSWKNRFGLVLGLLWAGLGLIKVIDCYWHAFDN